jgi:tetratricopeptide (TPR) repeat protein
MKRKTLTFVLAAVAGAVVVLFGGVLGGAPGSAAGPRARPDVVAAQALGGPAPGDTAEYVRELEARVAQAPRDGHALTLLGLAYQQRARETADPSFYPRSGAALARGLRFAHQDGWLALTGLASLAAIRHRFQEALVLARRARALAPRAAVIDGVLGDALVELGRYPQAFAAFDRMAARKPSVASYARVAYARELLGRSAAALEAMRLAVDAGFGSSENVAWALVQLGNLYFDTGRLSPAERAYRAALRHLPDYVHAEAGLARVFAARGEFSRAVSLYRKAIARVPLPQYVIGLGDVLHVAGRVSESRQTYALVGAIEQLFATNGVRTELETALFDLDHGRDVRVALARAREAFGEAPSINAEDVLAWALYRNGRCRDAERHSERALRLGTRDALKLFHRGMIEHCLARPARARSWLARALAVNPHFSVLYAPVARRLVR